MGAAPQEWGALRSVQPNSSARVNQPVAGKSRLNVILPAPAAQSITPASQVGMSAVLCSSRGPAEIVARESFLEVLWLDKIQQPAQVERLLEAFAKRSGLLPEGAYRIRDPQALPDGLRRALTYVVARVWVCFSQGSRYWLFAGTVSPALSRLRNAPVLHVNCYCEDGELIDVRAWTVELGARGGGAAWEDRDR
jgi:hypothetical protein